MKTFPCSFVFSVLFSVIFTTIGQSQSWTLQNSGVTSLLWSVKAVDLNVAWAVGIGGTILRTTNGGDLWVSVGDTSIANDVHDIEAFDSLNAIVASTYPDAGGNAFLFKTTNGGTTWTRVFSLVAPGAFINAVRMYDRNRGLAVGDPVAGKWVVRRTTDEGKTWTPVPEEPPQLGGETGIVHGMTTYGSRYAWFTPGFGGNTLYRTTDAGSSWSALPLPLSTFSPGIWFADSLVGIIGSADGSVIRTSDGGVNWQYLTVPSSGQVWGIAGTRAELYLLRGSRIYRTRSMGAAWDSVCTSPIGRFIHIGTAVSGSQLRAWAVTEWGAIMSYVGPYQPTSVDIPPGMEMPQSLSLHQSYPNPCNPSATISYELPFTTSVRMTIHNLLGQEMLTLADGLKVAGRHTERFDGSNLGSGVYFYRLEAGGKSLTRKLLLMK